MSPIQILLVTLIAFMFVLILKLRSRNIYRAAVMLAGFAGVVLVLFPGLSNRIAALCGVGRGADFVFYIGFMSLTLFTLRLYIVQKGLEEKMTIIARKMALEENPSDKKKV